MKVVVALLGGLLIVAVVAGGIFSPNHSTVSVPVAVPAMPIPVMVTTAGKQAAWDKAKADYMRDRDAVRKAKPKTEDDVQKIIGRPADDITELPQFTIVMWYYDDKDVGRDVLQITVQNGKITAMSL